MKLTRILKVKMATAIALFGIACQEEPELRSRPVEDGDDLPGYLDEVTQYLPAKEAASVSISESTIEIEPDTTNQDSSVRLRTLSAPPARDELVDLASPLGDVLEITFYETETEEIFSSNLFDKPFELNQTIKNDINQKHIKYVVVTSPNTSSEKIRIISRNAITVKPSSGLILNTTQVSIELKLTHAIVYAVEAETISASIEIINTGTQITNDSTGAILSNENGAQQLITPTFPVTFQQRITPQGVPSVTSTEDHGEDDFFGSSIASDGQFMAVGAHRQDFDRNGENAINNSGLVFIFKKEGDSWTQMQILDAEEFRSDQMNLGGYDTWENLIAMVGDYLIVGTHQDNYYPDMNSYPESIRIDAIVYKRDQGVYQLHQVINRPGTTEYSIASAIAVSGSTLVIGTVFEGTDENGVKHSDYETSGSAYIYNLENDKWNFAQKIKGRDHSNRINKDDLFGYAAIEGNTIAVGASHFDWDGIGSTGASNTGAVFVYDFDGSSWSQTTILQPETAQENNDCGRGVGISGKTLVFGCRGNNIPVSEGGHSGTYEGAVFIFEKNEGLWQQQAKLSLHPAIPTAKSKVAYCGAQTHLQGDKLLVSCPHWTVGYSSAFAAFSRNDGTWAMDQIEIGTKSGRHVGALKMVDEMVIVAFPRRAASIKLHHIVWESGYVEYWQ